MKKALILTTLILILPSLLAINLEVNQVSSDEVMILGLNQPATFDLQIINNGQSDSFMFYSYFGSNLFPKGTVEIKSGETKDVQLKIYPTENLKKGFVKFDYFIKSQDGSELKKELLVKIIDLSEAFEVGSGEVNPESNSIEIYIQNKVNFNFEGIDSKFSSPFFEFDKKFSLVGNEKKNFQVTLNKEDFKKLIAGFYTLNAKINIEDLETETEGIIKFVEKGIIKTNIENYGLIVRTKIVEKTNDGNTVQTVQTVVNKNIISRLFTTPSPEPDSADRDGFRVYYSWNKQINPGETLKITVITNWILPFITILLIIAIVIFVKQYTKTNLRLRKRITFVKSKGGEFALKVSIIVHAKKHVDNIIIIDRLPPLLKLYEKFGKETPTKIDATNRKLEWNYNKLEAGEKRLINYVIYSKVGIVGKFALPSTSAIYEYDGELKETNSNKVFFLTEQRGNEVE